MKAHSNVFYNERFPDLQTDTILINSPCNASSFTGLMICHVWSQSPKRTEAWVYLI